MAHLRKKERWMIEGKSLAKTAELCGVHSTTAFRWRHRFLRSPAADKPRTLSGIVEADETFVLESFKGRWVRSSAQGPQTGREGRTSGPPPGQHSHSCRPRSERRDLRRGSAPGRQRFGGDSPRRRCHARQSFGRRRGPGDRRLCRQSRDCLPRRAVAGQTDRRGTPHLHINNVNAYHSRLKQWLKRFNGVATKNLPNYLGWRRALEAWGDQLAPQTWIKGAIGNGPYDRGLGTNRTQRRAF